MQSVVKCSVFLRDIADFPRMNEVYKTFFGDTRPARTTVEAKFFQAEMLVEIDCVAYQPK
jgi:2-iminobutanoate/2-iminopropanoate deaminase